MLRTSNELLRYDVKAVDGRIGSVEDLLFDDRDWKIKAIVVETGNFLRHHEVLVDPMDVAALKFPQETMSLVLSKQEVENAPGLERNPPVSKQELGSPRNLHLRSCNEIYSYEISATDRDMGKITGFVIETTTWTIRYLVVDTGEWLMEKLVLLGPHTIEAIDWSGRSMQVNVTAEAIRGCPVYDEHAELSRSYEAFLHDYYGWSPYWL